MPSSISSSSRRTALYEAHKAAGAQIVDFHGWELPLHYGSIIKEHQAVRLSCGLFDVSHMGQVFVSGGQAEAFLQKVDTNDLSKIFPGKAVYSHLPNEKGGVVDDVIAGCLAHGRYLVIVNAANIVKDFEWLSRQAADFDVRVEDKSDDYGIIAVQGPRAAEIVSCACPEAVQLPRFGILAKNFLSRHEGFASRTGYTGEDGFELIVPNAALAPLWDQLLDFGKDKGIAPCGLGARDTLRLEAGYLLYGNDIDDEHSPLEAGYDWVVKLSKGDFIGKAALLRQKKEGLRRRMAGVRLKERGVPRAGASVFVGGKFEGILTSATFSPTLQCGIGMGYLSPADLRPGAEAEVECHGRKLKAEIVPIPFYRKK